MKVLKVKLQNGEELKEYHTNTIAANSRLAEICDKLFKGQVVSCEVQDAVKHVEVKEQPVLTKQSYTSIK